jgi:DNA-binding CsgD family transcriptional regulator
VLPEGYEPTSRDSMGFAVATVLWIMYADRPKPTRPASSMNPTKTERNREIIQRYLAGERAVDLAQEFGISVRRVNRLIRRYLDRGQV